MSEMLRLYLFQLDFFEDMKHIIQFGIPYDVIPPVDHNFYMWDRKLKMQEPSNKYYVLDLGK